MTQASAVERGHAVQLEGRDRRSRTVRAVGECVGDGWPRAASVECVTTSHVTGATAPDGFDVED